MDRRLVHQHDAEDLDPAIAPSVRALDMLLNKRIAESSTNADQDTVLRLKLAIKRRLADLPDPAIEAEAAAAIRELDESS